MKKLSPLTAVITLPLVRQVYKRDAYICRYCGFKAWNRPWFLQVDHFYPKSQGGQTVLANLNTSCGPCNDIKGDRIFQDIKSAAFYIRQEKRKIKQLYG